MAFVTNSQLLLSKRMFDCRRIAIPIQRTLFLGAIHGQQLWVKFWILADGFNYYISNVELYAGKGDSRTTTLGGQVVMRLVIQLYGSGRNITRNNFFTILQLPQRLEIKQLFLVSTIRAHRREAPFRCAVKKTIRIVQLCLHNRRFDTVGAI